MSAILFCVYVNDLSKLLRKRRSGWWIDGHSIGIPGYSDDIFLLAPCVDSLKDMAKTCEDYAMSRNLEFSTNSIPKKSKTKCMSFTKNDRVVTLPLNCHWPIPSDI